MAAIVIRRSLALVVALVSASIPKFEPLAPCAMWLRGCSKDVAPAPIELRTETFPLTHAKAVDIAGNVLDLFEASPDADTKRARGTCRRGSSRQHVRGQLRSVVADAEVNSVTITADAITLAAIGELIREEWDRPSASRVYTLEHTDAGAVAERLRALLDSEPDGCGRRGANPIISKIEPCPETNQLVVVYRTSSRAEAMLGYLDEFICELDQPAFAAPIAELDAEEARTEPGARAAADDCGGQGTRPPP